MPAPGTWRSSSSPSSSGRTSASPRGQSQQPSPPAIHVGDLRSISHSQKDQLIEWLRSRRVNTITELRRIEKIFAFLDSAEVTEPMTSAWANYVNSNNLLNELRGLTRKFPFSSECLDEAKQLVVNDPASIRSWNYCWLVLVKIEREYDGYGCPVPYDVMEPFTLTDPGTLSSSIRALSHPDHQRGADASLPRLSMTSW